MVCLQVLARLRKQALLFLAHAASQLLLAGRLPEIRRWPSYVMDISFEILILRKLPGLIKQGFMASCLQDPSLVEGKGAEVAAPKASPVADQAELHFRDGWHASQFLIGRMVRPPIRIPVNLIHLRLVKRHGRRILYHVQMLIIRLYQPLSGKWIRILVLGIKTARVRKFFSLHLFIFWKGYSVVDALQAFGPIYGSWNEGNILDIDSALQRLGNLNDRTFPHPIGDQIRTRIQKNGALQPVRPVVVMRKPP